MYFESFPESIDSLQIEQFGLLQIHIKSAQDDEDFVKQMISKNGVEMIEVRDFYMNTPLHYAALYRAYSVAKVMLSMCKNNDFYNINHLTPLHIAAINGDFEMVKILSKSKEMLDALSFNLWSPFHFAVFFDNIEIVKYLLKLNEKYLNQIIIDCEDICNTDSDLKFFTPMDIALKVGNEDVIQFLRDKNAYCSLHAAVKENNYRALSYHIFKLKDLDKRDICGSTALHLGAFYGNYKICNTLLKSGASANIIDNYGMTPLDYSIISNSFYAFDVISKCTNPKYIAKAFFTSADFKRSHFFLHLLKLNFDVNYVNDKGDSLLIHLAKRDFAQCISSILPFNPDLEFKNQNGETIYHYSCLFNGDVSMIFDKMEYNCKDKNGLIPFSYAVRKGNSKVIKFLKEKSDLESVDLFGMTPALYTLANEGNLITLPANLHKRYTINIKKLADSIKSENEQIKFFNFEKNTEEIFDYEFASLFSPVYCSSLTSSSIKLFLERTDGIIHGGTILHIAILFGIGSGYIVKYFSELINIPDEQGIPPLFLAAQLSLADCVAVLINLNASPYHKDLFGNSLLHYIDNKLVFKFIKNILPNLKITKEYINNNGETPIHILCKKNAVDVLKSIISFLDNYSILSIKDKENNTPLDYTLKYKSKECMDLLHSFGVNNLLILAIQSNDFVKVKKLIDDGYSVNSSDIILNTPLHAAIKTNNYKVTEYLIQNKANINAKSSEGYMPIHIAAMNNNYDICCLLLKQGINLLEFGQEEQPYLLSTNLEVKSLLCHYWKRQYFLTKFFDFIALTQNIIGYIKLFTSEIIRQTKDDSIYFSFVSLFENLIHNIELTTSKLRNYISTKTFNFMDSLHNLFISFKTVETDKYTSIFEKMFDSIVNYFINFDSEFETCQIQYILIFPLKWTQHVFSCIKKLKRFLIPKIDNFDLYDDIFKKYTKETKIISNLLNNIQEKLTINFTSTFEKEIIPKIRTGLLTTSASAFITKIINKPICTFNPQQFFNLKCFFTDEFELPRKIPFFNNDHVKIYIKGINLIILNSKDYFIIPLFFLNLTMVKNGIYNIVSPVGTFRLTFNINIQYYLFKNSIDYFSVRKQKFQYGESTIINSTNQESYFQCLVIYQFRGEPIINVQTMILCTNNPKSCFDICYSKLIESNSSRPIFFNITSILQSKLSHEITVL